ncbi:MAG: hypothetical protein EOP32_02410 [Rhodococcus sp. (in: high G+C Gram-positive bacteria)]|nr:MAG: hypothetical protein EOP32_02410 [Rhodococcus sp. (in: high G+C Gram-positive bacteria)]
MSTRALGKSVSGRGVVRDKDRRVVADSAAALDDMGYRAFRVPGGFGGPVFDDIDAILPVSPNTTVATAVLNVWMHEAPETDSWVARVRADHPSRMILGLGASHEIALSRSGRNYSRPLGNLRAYLDQLAEQQPVPVQPHEMVLAAL